MFYKMQKRYEVTFNDVLLLKSSTKKSAVDFMKSLNKNSEIIKSIIKKIEKDGGQVFGVIYVDKKDDEYIYPIAQKRIWLWNFTKRITEQMQMETEA